MRHDQKARSWMGLLLMLALLGMACGEQQPPAPEVVRPVRAFQVPDPSEDVLPSFTGRARAEERSDLSFEVGGRMIERLADVGTRVEKGQLLARLDPRDFEQALRAARAKAGEARAYLGRVAEAHAARAVSDQELTNAESELQAAEATLRIREKALEDSQLVAPHAGRIAAVFAEDFQVVRPRQTIFRLLDTSRIEMVIDVPENRIELARYIDEVSVRFDAFPELEVTATVSEIGTEASATTRTYPVTLVMEQPEGARIQAGMTGRARTRPVLPEGQTHPPVAVPRAAIFEKDGAPHVWVLDPQTKQASPRAVTVSARGRRGVPVEEGLQIGEWVAISGTGSLREGQAVQILDVEANELRLPMPEERRIRAGDVTLSSLEH